MFFRNVFLRFENIIIARIEKLPLNNISSTIIPDKNNAIESEYLSEIKPKKVVIIKNQVIFSL